MKQYRTINQSGFSPDKEKIRTKSETVPDMALSVREILLKYANGTLGDLSDEYEYSGDDDDLRGLDPAELHAMATEASNTLKEQDERQSRKRKSDERKKLKDELILELQNEQSDAGTDQ